MFLHMRPRLDGQAVCQTRRVPDLGGDVVAWIEDVTDATVTSTSPVPAGGRLGWFVDVQERGGGTRALFVQLGRGGLAGSSSFMPFTREAEVLRALEPVGVPVAHVWAVDTALDALLLDRLPGVTWFHAPADPAEELSVAQDFIRHLAAWHSVPARDLDLPSFQPVKTVREHQLDQLEGIRAVFESEDARRPIDALALLTLDILEKVPDVPGEPVLVQGDTGPGNLMYADGRVTGIVDWELAHLGDPMDDIAWLSWRATQHGFPDFPARLREYEQLTGTTIDEDRVRYYRVNACARLGPWFGLASMGESTPRPAGTDDAAGDDTPNVEADRTADGSGLIMAMLHRRMRLTALADAIGLELPSRDDVDEAHPKEHAYLYDNVLEQLQTMVPRIDDRAAANLAKGVARQVKYLKEIDRNGDRFAGQELDDIARLIGRDAAPSLAVGRPRLAVAARDGRVPIEEYLLYHWRRTVRDDHLMKPASGRMYERGWPALS
jgi:aminoglycoside phosphotransferase (APT) family kinase protein